MEYCDRGCLGAAIKRGSFRAVEGRWGRDTALRCLIRTAKEMAQVRRGARGGMSELMGFARIGADQQSVSQTGMYVQSGLMPDDGTPQPTM